MKNFKFRAAWIVAQAELKNFWGGSSSGVALLVFLGLSGFFFYNNIVSYILESLKAAARSSNIDAVGYLFSQGLSSLPLILMLITPLVSMRSLSPFSRGGGLDYLQTLPLGDFTLISGQYLAAFISLSCFCFLALLPYGVLILFDIGSPEMLLCAIVGFLSLASAFAAIGLLASAAFTSPVGAGLGTLGLIGLMWVLGWAAPYSSEGLGVIWRSLSFSPRIVRFFIGLINPADLFFFAAVTILSLANAYIWLNLRRRTGAD